MDCRKHLAGYWLTEIVHVLHCSGFIVFNTVTYPNFLRFVQSIGAEIINSDMSFAVSRHGYRVSPKRSKGETEPVRGWFEWAGGSPAALFCQSTNLLNPGHWRMVWDIIRFNQQSLETLRAYEKGGPSVESMSGSIGEWLDARGYGQTFRRNYLIVSSVRLVLARDSKLTSVRLTALAANDRLDLVDSPFTSVQLLPSSDASAFHAQPPSSADFRPSTMVDITRWLQDIRGKSPREDVKGSYPSGQVWWRQGGQC